MTVITVFCTSLHVGIKQNPNKLHKETVFNCYIVIERFTSPERRVIFIISRLLRRTIGQLLQRTCWQVYHSVKVKWSYCVLRYTQQSRRNLNKIFLSDLIVLIKLQQLELTVSVNILKKKHLSARQGYSDWWPIVNLFVHLFIWLVKCLFCGLLKDCHSVPGMTRCTFILRFLFSK